MINIILADNQQMVRDGLRTLLEKNSDIRVIGEAANGKEACRLVLEMKPDVMVMDIMMDGLDGLDAAHYISKNTTTEVIMLSIHSARCYVAEAMQAGAKAYILKQSNVNELLEAIYRVKEGKRYFSKSIAEIAASCEQEAEVNSMTPFTPLTSRERDVFYLLAQGFTNAEVAQQLFISRRTAETHRSQIMRKLGLHHMVELVFYALREGINTGSLALDMSKPNRRINLNFAAENMPFGDSERELVLQTN